MSSPSSVLTQGLGAWGTPSLLITMGYGAGAAGPSASIGLGTLNPTEADMVNDGLSVFITLTNDTWVAGGLFDDTVRQAIIDGLDSAQSEATGWNALVRDVLAVGTVVRAADDIVSIIVPATPGYDLTALETITVTVPESALAVSGVDLIGTPSFSINTFTPPVVSI